VVGARTTDVLKTDWPHRRAWNNARHDARYVTSELTRTPHNLIADKVRSLVLERRFERGPKDVVRQVEAEKRGTGPGRDPLWEWWMY